MRSLLLLLALAPELAAQCQLAKLIDTDTDHFGGSVSVAGDVAWVGGLYKAAAYLRTETGWGQTDEFSTGFADQFGEVIVTDGELAVVGASFIGHGGSAYVYRRSGATWHEVAHLQGLGSTSFDAYGTSVALSGSTIFVGAYLHSGAVELSGKVHVYEEIGGVWTEVAPITAPAVHPPLYFGSALAASGDRLLIGAQGNNGVSGYIEGSAYVFERSGDTWVQTTQLVAPDGQDMENTGHAVALDGDVAAVASAFHSHNHIPEQGGVFVFELQGGSWVQTAELSAPEPAVGDQFGYSVAISGERILVGTPYGDQPTLNDSGAAYLFERIGGAWTLVATLTTASGEPPYQFSRAVALDGDIALIGAEFEADTVPLAPGGAAYVFDVDGATAWEDLGQALAGSAGPPTLLLEGELCANHSVTLELAHAAPGAAGTLVIGLGLARLPFKGGTLVPQPDALAPLTTDAAGVFSLSATLASDVPALVIQAWIEDAAGPAGFAASNAVAGTL